MKTPKILVTITTQLNAEASSNQEISKVITNVLITTPKMATNVAVASNSSNADHNHVNHGNHLQLPYRGMSLLYLKNHTKALNMMTPQIPVIIRTQLNAEGTSNNGISKFIPNIPATTPKMATTNVAVVSKSSNWIS